MNHLVNIIIPAYNAAKRIEKTLSSILEQDYPNIEVIVVDDASSDGTGDVAENVLKTAGREYKVVRHETNMGVSSARNSGLAAASGDYVMFFDADDIAEPEFVSVLLGVVTSNGSDAAFCGYRDRFESTGREQTIPVKLDFSRSRKYSAGELAVMYIFGHIEPSICTTMFKTSFLKDIALGFTAGCSFGEDMEFLAKAFSRCGSINFSTACHYIYIHHEDQVSRTIHQTPEKSLRRYADNALAVCRAARYIAEHAESPKVRGAAGNFMLAEGLTKILNIAARQRDEARFYETLRSPETKRALKASLRYLTRKPELVFKALALLLAPGLYYSMRSRS